MRHFEQEQMGRGAGGLNHNVYNHQDRRMRPSDEFVPSRGSGGSGGGGGSDRKEKSKDGKVSSKIKDPSKKTSSHQSSQQFSVPSQPPHMNVNDEQQQQITSMARRADDWVDPWIRTRNNRRNTSRGREKSYSSSSQSSSSSSRSSRSRSRSSSYSSRSRSSRPRRRSPSVTRSKPSKQENVKNGDKTQSISLSYYIFDLLAPNKNQQLHRVNVIKI